MLGLGSLVSLLGLYSMMKGQKQGAGAGLPPGVNLETLETTDYVGDPGKTKPFINTLTD